MFHDGIERQAGEQVGAVVRGGMGDSLAADVLSARRVSGRGSDVKLGEIGGVPFYMSASQLEYWQHTHLIIDVVPGRGGMFSLEGPEGVRFLTRSRLYSDDEWTVLKDMPVEKAQ